MVLGLFGGTRGKGTGARVPPGTRVYAVGDSHGCCDQLRDLHREILEDALGAEPRAERRVVVYLGDYVDRGPDSRDLLDLLIDGRLTGFETVHLMGNHDDFVLRFLAGEDPTAWLMNGGDATLRSYGIDPQDSDGIAHRGEWLREQLAARLPDDHLAFLQGLGTMHTEGDYVFVHAGIRPGVPIPIQEKRDLLWIREPFLESRADHGKVVVHGHTPTAEPDVRANRIGIDTGACYGGRLTALALEGDTRRFVQV